MQRSVPLETLLVTFKFELLYGELNSAFVVIILGLLIAMTWLKTREFQLCIFMTRTLILARETVVPSSIMVFIIPHDSKYVQIRLAMESHLGLCCRKEKSPNHVSGMIKIPHSMNYND